MKKHFLFLIALLLSLCACAKLSATNMSADPSDPVQDLPQSTEEIQAYLEGHVELAGSLPSFCKVVKIHSSERFEAGVDILTKAKAQFPSYLYEQREYLPEGAFAEGAVWTLSDTPRGNLLLQGPGVTLVYNADADEVHPPCKLETGSEALPQLQTRFAQASVAPNFDRESPAGKAFLQYLQTHLDVFQDDGESVLDDTAWIIRRDFDGSIVLCFLRENPFCGLSQSTLIYQNDGTVVPVETDALDLGYFTLEENPDWLQDRLKAAGCPDTAVGAFSQWLTDHSVYLESVKNCLWLVEPVSEKDLRLRFLSPGDDRYCKLTDAASDLTVEQLWLVDGQVRQGAGGVLFTASHTVSRFDEDREIGMFSLQCPVWDIPIDQWNGFYQAGPPSETCDRLCSYSNGDLTVCCNENMVLHLHILTDAYTYKGVTLGDSVERFWTAFQDTESTTWLREPAAHICRGVGFSAAYLEEDGRLTALWIYAYV